MAVNMEMRREANTLKMQDLQGVVVMGRAMTSSQVSGRAGCLRLLEIAVSEDPQDPASPELPPGSTLEGVLG